ncbi:MAG: hypothetical protein L0154_13955 [Chloroflexi bacterium]|nr:hypothetical protein [Chloroflexota bacterium]
MFKKLVLLIIIALVAMPAHAQDDDLIAYVETAFTNLYSQGTYTLDGSQHFTVEMLSEDARLDYDIEFEWMQGINNEGAVQAVSGTIQVDMAIEAGFENLEAILYQEAMFEDNVYYALMTMEIAGSVESPLGWMDGQWIRIDLNQLPDGYWEELGVDEVTFDTIQQNMGNEFSSRYFLPVSADVVTSISELDPVTEDGRPLRVFAIEIDSTSGVLEGFDTVFSTVTALQGVNPQNAAGIEEMVEEILKGFSSSQVIYVDEETHLPQRVLLTLIFDYRGLAESFSEFEGLADMMMTMEVDTTFSDIGEPFHVSPPKEFEDLPPEFIFE